MTAFHTKCRPCTILAKHRTRNQPLGKTKFFPVRRKSQGKGHCIIDGNDEPEFQSSEPLFTVTPGAMCQIVPGTFTNLAKAFPTSH